MFGSKPGGIIIEPLLSFSWEKRANLLSVLPISPARITIIINIY